MSKLDTSKYHGHPRFYEILEEMADLHSRKNHDYSGDDPLSNLRASEEIGIPAWKGILVRLMDKWGRLKTFARTGNFEVKDESVKDTLMDNAVYSILCIIVLEEEKSKCQKLEGTPQGVDREELDTTEEIDESHRLISNEPPPEVSRKIYEAEGFEFPNHASVLREYNG